MVNVEVSGEDGRMDTIANAPWAKGETDPTAETGYDSDKDDMPDRWEVRWRAENGSYYLDPTIDDAEDDPDDDTLENYWEYEFGTSPITAHSDIPDDGFTYGAHYESVWINLLYQPFFDDGTINLSGLSDGYEVTIGSNPLSPYDDFEFDSDGDGIPDIFEDRDQDYILDPMETDPENPDTDNDGMDDLIEIIFWRYWLMNAENPLSLFQERYMVLDWNTSTYSYLMECPVEERTDNGTIALITAIDYANPDMDAGGSDVEGYDLDGDSLPDGAELSGWYVFWERNPTAEEKESGKVTAENPKIEFQYWVFSNPLLPNADGDDLNDTEEYGNGTDPNTNDTDYDGLLDYPRTDDPSTIPEDRDFDSTVQEEIPAMLAKVSGDDIIHTKIEVKSHWETWNYIPVWVYDGTSVTAKIKATDNAALAYTYITFKPDDDPKHDETRLHTYGEEIDPGTKVYYQTEVFQVSFWKDGVGAFKVTGGCGDLAMNEETSVTVAGGLMNEIQEACMAFLSNFLTPEMVGYINGFVRGFGQSFFDDLNMFNPLTWGDLIKGIIKIPELIMDIIKDPSMIQGMIKGLVGKSMMMADMLTPYDSSDLTGEEWCDYLWDAIMDLFDGGGFDFSMDGILNLVYDVICLDFPSFSYTTCGHNVFYFFGDLAGFIVAQILDPAMYLGGLMISKIAGLVTNALGMIGIVKKVDQAGDAAKALDDLADAGHTGKIAEDAIDAAQDMAKHVDDLDFAENAGDFFNFMDGYCDVGRKLGTEGTDLLNDYNTVRIIGKGGENVDWTADRMRSLQKLANENPSLLKKIDELADTPGIEKVTHEYMSTKNWDVHKLDGQLSKGIKNNIDEAYEVKKAGNEIICIEGKQFKDLPAGKTGRYQPDITYKAPGETIVIRENKLVFNDANMFLDGTSTRNQIENLNKIADPKKPRELPDGSGLKVDKAEIVVKSENGQLVTEYSKSLDIWMKNNNINNVELVNEMGIPLIAAVG